MQVQIVGLQGESTPAESAAIVREAAATFQLPKLWLEALICNIEKTTVKQAAVVEKTTKVSNQGQLIYSDSYFGRFKQFKAAAPDPKFLIFNSRFLNELVDRRSHNQPN